jgi:plastocyanin
MATRRWWTCGLLLAVSMLLPGASACGGRGGGKPSATPSPRAAATQPAATPSVATAAPTPGPAVTPTAGAQATATEEPRAQATAAHVATEPPAPSPSVAPPPPAASQALLIVAKDTAFAPGGATVSAGVPVALTFDNQDAGVEHDIEIFGVDGHSVASTELAPGPSTMSVTFTLVAPGRYPFKCTVHPQQMRGAISAQ